MCWDLNNNREPRLMHTTLEMDMDTDMDRVDMDMVCTTMAKGVLR